MGVFLFTNKQVNTDKVESVFKSRGHKNIIKVVNKDETLVVSGKILVETTNCLSGSQLNNGGKNDEYIIGVGTYFYDGKYGEAALKKIFENLETVLEDNPVYGHWAFVIHKNGRTYIFNDMNGSLRLYSYERDGQLIISTSPASVVAAIQKPQIDRLLLSAYLGGNYGNEIVPIEGIENFNSFKYLVIENERYSYKERKVPEIWRIETIKDAVHYVRGLFDEQVHQLKGIGDERISIELTAGLDSRLIASVLKTNDFNYDFLNYPLFGPDKKVADLIAKGLRKRVLIQTNEKCLNDIDQHYGEWDFGFNFFRQYPNPRWIIENNFQFSGARGECISTPPTIEICQNGKIEPTLEKILAVTTIGENMTDVYKKKYHSYLVDYFCARFNMPLGKRLTEKQQSDLIQQLFGGLSGDYMYNSGCQAHIYYYSIFNEWHFNQFVKDIAFNVKTGRKLTLSLIKEIDHELASYPFVSHRRTKCRSVDAVNSLPTRQKSYNRVKEILPATIVNYIYGKMGRSFNKETMSSIDFDYYKDVVIIEMIKKYPNLYSEILNRMYSINILRELMEID